MVVAVWSVKGGVGVSSVAALLALGQVEQAHDTVLVDLCGDASAVLGCDESNGPGVVDWCALPEPTPDALARIEVDARPGLSLLPRGTGDFPNEADALVSVLSLSSRQIIVDCGYLAARASFQRSIVAAAPNRLLVVRECYLGLRSARDLAIRPTGVIVVKERGRRLGRADVETTTGAPVVAEVAVDSGIANAIDAGLVQARLPRSLIRQLARVVNHAA